MNISSALLLGAVQGLTEFLPVSSSGHLILVRNLFHLSEDGGLAFDALLQLGTIIAVTLYFSKELLRLAGQAWLLLKGQKNQVINQDKALLGALVIGTIPAVIAGLLLEDLMETTFRTPLLIAITLLIGSAFMFVAERRKAPRIPLTPKRGFWIGCFQSLALFPGFSRSGSTIAGGLLLGLSRETAVSFSFLLSIPIIAGSGLKKTIDLIQTPQPGLEVSALLVGLLTSFVVGLGAIHFLTTYLKRNSLTVFIVYRFALATGIIFILM